jgi:hypothetical protein
MKWILFLFILTACNQELKVGECVIGTRMDVWKLMRMDGKKYLFVTLPIQEDSPVEIVEDVSAFKKVDCPL